MQQLPEKRNPTHHLESRNYILNVRELMPVNAVVTTSLLMCGAVIPVQLNFMKGSD